MTATMHDHIIALSRMQADYLDFMNTDVNTALSTLAYATARILRAEAFAQGINPQTELDRFCDMLRLADLSENTAPFFNLN